MKKFLSLILALTLVASLFTVNVMAASIARTVTLSVDKTTELQAGDTVTVEITIDNTANLVSMGYILHYDTDAFEVDMNEEAYQDVDWYEEITDAGSAKNKKFAGYLTTMLYTPVWDWDNGKLASAGTAGEINYKWSGANAVPEAKNEENKLIGKFYINVKEDAADGEYVFSLTGLTGDGGENSTADMVCAPVTVKVGADAPVDTPAVVGGTTAAATNGVASADSTKIYDNALAVSAEITPGTKTTEIGVLFAPKAWLGANELAATLAGVAKASKAHVLGDGATTLKAAIKDIPRALQDTDIVMVTRAYAFDGTDYTYANAVETTVNFTKTAE